ncbi:MAG: hypothetical protein PVSMB9_05320 [Candidatus Dormibacteria bacterium]
MASLLSRWRTPLITAVGIWVLSFPLLTSHTVTMARPVAAAALAASSDAGERGLLRQLSIANQPAPTAQAVAPAAAAPVAATQPAAPSGPAAVISRPLAPAPPALRANWIVIPRLGVSLPVGWYGDCLGRAAVPHWGAWRWSCAGSNNTYITAHNPGTFTPILGLHAGDLVQYGDPSGRVHTYRVSSTTIVSNTQLWPLGATPVSSLTLQTCWTWDGSRDFIVRAVEI